MSGGPRPAGVGERDEDPAAVLAVADAGDEALALQPVDELGGGRPAEAEVAGLLTDAQRTGDGEEAEQAEHPRGDVGPGNALAGRLEASIHGGVEETHLGDHGLGVCARHVPWRPHLRANPPR